MCDVLCELINQHVPVPPAARRRRVLVRVGEQLQFSSGLSASLQAHSGFGGVDLRLRWSFGPNTMAMVTCYEPVSLVSDCGMRMVIRAVMLHGIHPVAVLAEIEGVEREPFCAVRAAA